MASDELTEYERKRLENIKRNSEMMASLKIHSHLSNLAASSKRLREEKSYKQNSEKKPKAETPVVIRRRSLRIMELPPEFSDSPTGSNDPSAKPSESINAGMSPAFESGSLPLEDVSMEVTYVGEGSHLSLVKKLGRIGIETKSKDKDEVEDGNLNDPAKFVGVKSEEPSKDEVEDGNLNDPAKFVGVKSEESSDPCLVKVESDNVAHVVPRRSTRKKKLDDQEDQSNCPTEFEGVKVKEGEGIDPHLLNSKHDDITHYIPQTSTRKAESDYENGCSKSPTNFDRVRLEEPIDPCSLRLEDENIARVVPGKIFSLRFFPTKEMTMIAVGNKYGHLGFWDVKPQNGEEEEEVIHLYKPHEAPISGISVHPDTMSKVYTSCYDNNVRMMNIEMEKFELVYTSTSGDALYSLAQLPNDVNSVYFGEGPGGLIRFDVRMGKVSSSWPVHEGRVNSIDFSPINSNLMATSTTDGYACIWDIRNINISGRCKHPERKALYTVKHERAVHSAYFSPSGHSLATTSLDDNIGVLCGVNFEDTVMIPHSNRTNRWVQSFRAVWGWDDTHLYIGNMKRKVDVLSVTHRKTVHALESPNMTAIPCRYDAHPCNVGMMAGATSGGQVYIWTASS